MIVVDPVGGRSIRSQTLYRRAGRHDVWLAHADGPAIQFYGLGLSGLFYTFYRFTLESGETYYYRTGTFPSEAAATAFINSWQGWTAPDGLVGFEGLWFNFAVRSGVTDKVPLDDILDWLDDH